MKKYLFLFVIAGVIFWLASKESMIDKLMAVEFPIQESEKVEVRLFEPERGSVVDMSALTSLGRITVVHLHKPSCRGCQIFTNNIAKLQSIRPDVAVTQVDSIAGTYTPTNQGVDLNVKFVPFVLIFDETGKLLAADDGDEKEGRNLFSDWLNAEIDRKNKQMREEWERKRAA